DHPEIRDVIVSGGDPLTLPAVKLRFFLDNLAAIPHVDVIRIGTRVPVTLPQKLYDQGLIDLLASAGKVWIQTHFNHPREITPEAARVCNALLRAGMPVNNHTVLLTATRGVSSLLQGTKSVLMPENSERMARRELHDLTNHHDAHATDAPRNGNGHPHTNGHGNGCCGGNGHHGHTEELLPLGQ